MIEMLGVLAIIGVLSAGGIMGYSAAMNAYTFNKFVKDVQHIVTATASVFPKLHNRTEEKYLRGEPLHRLGIIPDDLYKTAPSPSSAAVKNPFTGKTDWQIAIVENYDSGGTVTTNQGTYSYSKVYATFPMLHIQVPKKVCVKILSFDWRGLSSMGYFIRNKTYNELYFITSPIDIPTAQTICNYETNLVQLDFFVLRTVKFGTAY